MYQQIMIIGRLGGDPVKRFTAGGKAVTSFNVATGKSWTDAKGEKHDSTVWFRVSAWEKLAETCEKYLTKGKLVMVVGEMQEPKPFEGKDGTWRASLDLVARDVRFLSSVERAEEKEEVSESQDETEEIPF